MSEYIRVCPNCGREIKYKWRSDFLKASRKGSICKSCAASKYSIFKIGHHLNDSIVRNNSLDRLYTEISPQTFYWVGFDGSIQSNGSKRANIIAITAHKNWKTFYAKLLSTLNIPIHISEVKGANTIAIRICRREILLYIKHFIMNNNLTVLERKWNIIKEN